jgi:tRNA pseudouridine55 synthase
MNSHLNDSYLLGINKPVGVTSYHVVKQLKKALPGAKIGHMGSLDPFATGVLVCGVGRGSRFFDPLHWLPKTYIFTIQLGYSSQTGDPYGELTADPYFGTWVTQNPLSIHSIQTICQTFLGTITQIPPAYSALKYNGLPLYVYMRTQGALPFAIADKARQVQIHSLQCTDYKPHTQQITCTVSCSKGTYIRVLAEDIANSLGTIGYCLNLHRSAVGPFADTNCFPLDAITTENLVQPHAKTVNTNQLVKTCFPHIVCQNIQADNSLWDSITKGHTVLFSTNFLENMVSSHTEFFLLHHTDNSIYYVKLQQNQWGKSIRRLV